MAMDFPGQPTVGQVYTVGSISYVWNGYAWAGGGSQPLPATTIVSDTPPANPRPGQTWWESDTGILFMNYDDGNGPAQWVQINATIPSVPVDGGEYVWVNNIWRLKEQTVLLDVTTDIVVPALAKAVELIGQGIPTTPASAGQMLVRASYDGTTFPAAASDYSNTFFFNATLTPTAVSSGTSSAYTGMALSHNADHVTFPTMFSAELAVSRPTDANYFHGKAFGEAYSAALGYSTWFSRIMAVTAPAGLRTLKALRFAYSSGSTFKLGSYLTARWSY